MKQRAACAEHAEDLFDPQILERRPGVPEQVAGNQPRIGNAEPGDGLAGGVVAQIERFLARIGPAAAENGDINHR